MPCAALMSSAAADQVVLDFVARTFGQDAISSSCDSPRITNTAFFEFRAVDSDGGYRPAALRVRDVSRFSNISMTL